jgi:ABC-type branched-subunit amino acid transport system ATPase component
VGTAIKADDIGIRFYVQHQRQTLHSPLVRLLRREEKPKEFWAFRNVSFEIPQGSVTGIIGSNGSGKSTLLNALTGVVPASGTLHVGREVVALGQPGVARRAGIVRTHQTPHNYAELSCLDNACLAMLDPATRTVASALFRRRHVAAHERQRWARAEAALERVGLRHLAEVPAAALTYGQARLLELGRSLAGDPVVLLMDEPSAGLNAAETDELAALLRGLHDEGVALLVVDHKIDFIEAVSTRGVVLQLGRVIAEGPPAEVWRQAEVVDAYLGRAQAAEA